VAQEHLINPLANFSVKLPQDWGMPLGWAITFLPFAVIIAGMLFNLLWASRGMPFKMVVQNAFLKLKVKELNIFCLNST